MRRAVVVLILTGAVVLCGSHASAQRGDATNGASLYSQHCASCHGASGEGGVGPSHVDCSRCESLLSLYEEIDGEMPQNNPGDCVDQCAWDTAAHIFETLNGNAYPAPTANAGSDQTVQVGDTVTLDGSGSSDTVTGIWTYLWEQAGGPTVTLLNADTVSATFTSPEVSSSGTTLTFQLTVTNNGGVSDTDQVVVTVNLPSDDEDSGCFIDTLVHGIDSKR